MGIPTVEAVRGLAQASTDEVIFYYRFFSFSAACNVEIPGLIAAPTEHPDLNILLGCAPPSNIENEEELIFTSSIITETGEPAFNIFGRNKAGLTHIVYQNGIEFWLDAKNKKIWGKWTHPLTLDDASAYLLGPILGLMLRLRGIICLHASAVVIDGHAVVFAGEAGAGKSTTAAVMAQRGHSLLADDIVAIGESGATFLGMSAFPYVSLWPESARIIAGIGKGVTRFSPTYEKERFLPVRFRETSAPLGAIFILGERSSRPGLPCVQEITGREGIIALVANSYATGVLDKTQRAKEFEVFGRIISAVPIRRLLPHTNPALLSSLCNLIEECCRELPP
jgi:HPr Serine kinase C-terminal domain